MKYPCLVLDHDDTVVQSTVQLHYPAYLHTLRLLRPDVVPLSCEAFQEACDTPGLMALYEQEYGFTKEEMDFELTDWKAYVSNTIPDLFDGIGEVLTAYHKAGGMICVVSHSHHELIRRDYNHHFGFEPHLIYDLSFENNKPNPHPILDILEKTDFKKEQLLVVDDLPLGLQMAQGAGVDFAYAGWCQNPPAIHQKMVTQSPVVLSHPHQLGEILYENKKE